MSWWRLVETSVTAVGFEPTPLRTGALSQRLRPLGQTVVRAVQDMTAGFANHETDKCMDADARFALLAFFLHIPAKTKANMHQPGIKPGSHRWQRCILPLDH